MEDSGPISRTPSIYREYLGFLIVSLLAQISRSLWYFATIWKTVPAADKRAELELFQSGGDYHLPWTQRQKAW